MLKLSWKIVVRNGAISTASSLSIIAGMRSGPDAVLELSLCRSFATPFLLTLISCIAGYGTPSGVGMSLVSPLVHVDLYCLSRMSALSIGSAYSLPLPLRGATPLVFLRSELRTRIFSAWADVPALDLQLQLCCLLISNRTAFLFSVIWLWPPYNALCPLDFLFPLPFEELVSFAHQAFDFRRYSWLLEFVTTQEF